MTVLLLTGAPGVGKTTLIRKLPALLPDWRFGGFYTEEIRAGGERLGFRIATLNGAQRVMAHVGFAGHHRVGKYGVDLSAIDALAASALSLALAADAYLVDEIGKMECMSQEFVAATKGLFAAGRSSPPLRCAAKASSPKQRRCPRRSFGESPAKTATTCPSRSPLRIRGGRANACLRAKLPATPLPSPTLGS